MGANASKSKVASAGSQDSFINIPNSLLRAKSSLNAEQGEGRDADRNISGKTQGKEKDSAAEFDNCKFLEFVFNDKSRTSIYVRQFGTVLQYLSESDFNWEPMPSEWLEKGHLADGGVVSGSHGKDDLTTEPSRKSAGLLQQGEYTVRDKESGREVLLVYDWQQVCIAFHPQMQTRELAPVYLELGVPEIQDFVGNVSVKHSWNDPTAIVQTLRACNYDTEKFEEIYSHWKVNHPSKQLPRYKSLPEPEQTGGMEMLNSMVQSRTRRIEELTALLEQTRLELSGERRARETAVDSSKVAKFSATEQDSASLIQLLDAKRHVQKCKCDMQSLRYEVESTMEQWRQTTLNKIVYPLQMKLVRSNEQKEIMKQRYLAAALERKRYYNALQEARGNVRVFARVRNLSAEKNSSVKIEEDFRLVLTAPDKPQRTFAFERVFGPASSQEEVYEEIKALMMSCLDGYSVGILAYGQTGSGKTHTMMGSKEAPGVNLRAIHDLFALAKTRDADSAFEFFTTVLEVYNDKIYDLLGPQQTVRAVEIRGRDPQKGLILSNVSQPAVQSEKETLKILECAFQNRTVAQTAMNAQSSRSHLILTVHVKAHNKLTGESSSGRLMLVDLAGSERLAKAGTLNDSKLLAEATAINGSLSALSQVFLALRNKSKHVPYRLSKLTLLLQDLLDVEGKCCVFVTINPDSQNVVETASSLNFASEIKNVQLKVAQKNTKV